MGLLRSTFTILPGIGAERERQLWEKGVRRWEDLLQMEMSVSSVVRPRNIWSDELERAKQAWKELDGSYFSEVLAKRDYWRAIPRFLKKSIFVDIETTGLSKHYDQITLIGAFDGREYRVFVAGQNLEGFCEYLNSYEMIVTYNGTMFDLPFIEQEFPEIDIPQLHIDLRYVFQGLDVKGGLKGVENHYGLARPDDFEGFDGKDAAVAWRRFLAGDDSALERIIRYNIEDTVNLHRLLHIAYQEKLQQVKGDMSNKWRQADLQGTLRPEPDIGPDSCWNAHPEIAVDTIDKHTVRVKYGDGRELTVDRRGVPRVDLQLDRLFDRIVEHEAAPSSVGIDLTGSEEKPSGVAALDGYTATIDLRESDESITEFVAEHNPDVVSIDSPLGLPAGRCCAEEDCECQEHGIMRECERMLRGRGVPVYPCLLPSMKSLTLRGINLADSLREKGFTVIESYPGAAQDILDIPRKGTSVKELEAALLDIGIDLRGHRERISHDELDAITSALVGYFFLAGQYESLGPDEEGPLIIPEAERKVPDESEEVAAVAD